MNIFMLIYCHFFCLLMFLSENFYYLFTKSKTIIYSIGRPQAIFLSLSWGSYGKSSPGWGVWLQGATWKEPGEQELEKDPYNRTSPCLFKRWREGNTESHSTTSFGGEWPTATTASPEFKNTAELLSLPAAVIRLYKFTMLYCSNKMHW